LEAKCCIQVIGGWAFERKHQCCRLFQHMRQF
jgi:hypothetical protein